MTLADQNPRPEVILTRLRRLVTIWRATYIVQMILLLLFLLALGLEILMPGVLALLLRSARGAQLLLPCIALLLLALDPVAGVVEHRMGRQLAVRRTPLRRVLSVVYLIPGVMLLRRTLLVVLALIWLLVIAFALQWWFNTMVLLYGAMWLYEPLGKVFGRFVDFVDRSLNWLYTVLRSALRAISLSPARNIENEEHIVLPLLQARAAASYDGPPR
ncbi:MAG: hypothetical protein ABI333_12830 [bacterium]